MEREVALDAERDKASVLKISGSVFVSLDRMTGPRVSLITIKRQGNRAP